MTLIELAAHLDITEHAAYLLAGLLVGRHGYQAVILDAATGRITDTAADAIRNQATGRTNTVRLAPDASQHR